MGFFLLGSYIAYCVAVCDISFLVNSMLVYEETNVCDLDIYDSLEYVSYIICHGPCPFWLFWPLHWLLVLLEFSIIWEITTFIFPGWIVNSPVVLFVCTQFSSVLCNVVLVGDEIGSCLGRIIFATWLAMLLCPLRRLDLVLYLCKSGTLHVLPSYGCSIGGLTYVSSWMTRVSVCGGLLSARPFFIVVFVLMFTF